MDIIAIDDPRERLMINQYESMITTGMSEHYRNGPLGCGRCQNCDTVVIATGENLESVCWPVMHWALEVRRVIAKVRMK